MWSRRTIAVTISVACLSGVLGGCNDDSDDPTPDSGLPSASESSSAAPTTEPTPTEPSGPSAPVLPTAATKFTKAGAIAFVRYYLELLNYATHTGNVEPLRQHSTTNCVGCDDDATSAERLYARGGWAKGGDTSLKRVRATSPGRPEDIYVGTTVAVAKAQYKHRRGAAPQTLQAQQYDLDFYLNYLGGKWRVARLERS